MPAVGMPTRLASDSRSQKATWARIRARRDFLNVNQVDVLSVQHEYGFLGGKAGAHLLALLRELRLPIVTTLHTAVSSPNSRSAR
jgi:hypothetical protein